MLESDSCLSIGSVLKTFVHDPLVEWSKVKGSAESVQDRVCGWGCGLYGEEVWSENNVYLLIPNASGNDHH